MNPVRPFGVSERVQRKSDGCYGTIYSHIDSTVLVLWDGARQATAAQVEDLEPWDSNSPLTVVEVRKLSIANVWLMDVEADDGKLPPRMTELSALQRELTPAENREIIAWAWSTAPGGYWS